MSRSVIFALLATVLVAGCNHSDPPLPADVYEGGWDETTRSQRIDVLRHDLRISLDTLGSLAGDSERSAGELRKSARLLSALRAELLTTEKGRDEYEAFEQELEAMEGGSL